MISETWLGEDGNAQQAHAWAVCCRCHLPVELVLCASPAMFAPGGRWARLSCLLDHWQDSLMCYGAGTHAYGEAQTDPETFAAISAFLVRAERLARAAG